MNVANDRVSATVHRSRSAEVVERFNEDQIQTLYHPEGLLRVVPPEREEEAPRDLLLLLFHRT